MYLKTTKYAHFLDRYGGPIGGILFGIAWAVMLGLQFKNFGPSEIDKDGNVVPPRSRIMYWTVIGLAALMGGGALIGGIVALVHRLGE